MAFDLSAYVGRPVDVKISYVTDPNTGGIGAFVDDTRVTTTAGVLDADGFEGATSLWTLEGAPDGSAPNAGDFQFAGTLVEVAASVTTEDSVLLGYGIEQLATPAEQADVLGRIMPTCCRLAGVDSDGVLERDAAGGLGDVRAEPRGRRPSRPAAVGSAATSSSRGRRSVTAGWRPRRSGASGASTSSVRCQSAPRSSVALRQPASRSASSAPCPARPARLWPTSPSRGWPR